jgi:hypothetical protein
MIKRENPLPVDTEWGIDDWQRDLTEEEICRRLHRVGGDCICEVCGKPYYDHADEIRVLDWDGYPYLKRLCFGWFGKL